MLVSRQFEGFLRCSYAQSADNWKTIFVGVSMNGLETEVVDTLISARASMQDCCVKGMAEGPIVGSIDDLGSKASPENAPAQLPQTALPRARVGQSATAACPEHLGGEASAARIADSSGRWSAEALETWSGQRHPISYCVYSPVESPRKRRSALSCTSI